MTIGQLCFYDQIKQTLLATDHFQDNLATHFTASLGAVSSRCTSVTVIHARVPSPPP